MTAYLLDTNHLSPLVTLGHPLRQRVLQQLQAGDSFAIPAPALHEFLFGIGMTPRAQKNSQEWERMKANFTYYAVDAVDAEKAASLCLKLRREGWQLKIIDSFIAIVALRYHLTLLTTDGDFQRVPNLKPENWRGE